MEETHKVFGVEIRVTDVVPQEVIGMNNGRYLVLFWQGAEIGRIYPAPNNGLQADSAVCTCKVSMPSPEHTITVCRFCGKPQSR
jgi:hypothetical protein